MKYTFSSKEELIEQAIRDEACKEGIQWAMAQYSLETILKYCPLKYRLWALIKGYTQFADNCNWEELTGNDWAELLKEQPDYAEFCDWNKLDGYDWAYLLFWQPQFAEYCNWWKLIIMIENIFFPNNHS